MYRITQRRNIYFILSGLILVPGIIALIAWGLPLGIDFTGGTLIRLEFKQSNIDVPKIEEALKKFDVGSPVIQPIGSNELTIRLKHITNEAKDEIVTALKEQFGEVEEKSFESIGPTIGKELRQRALTAIILVLLFIVIYITFAFRKVSSGPVKSWAYGTGAIIALVHDLLIVIGVFAILGHYLNVEIDSLFVTALLTVLGFSVHDTIVVYDRIREQLRKSGDLTFEHVVNKSVNQTLVRSMGTSLTTLFVLIALFLFGGETIRYFVLALAIGIIAGTYSSIFIASPLLVVWNNLRRK